MHAIPVTHPEPRVVPEYPVPIAQPALHQVAGQNSAAVEAAEVTRWLRLLGVPFVLSAAFFMAVISTGQLWLIGGALVTGPGLLIMAFIYLGLSSDTNGDR
jgi:hypothetical protein